MGRRYIALDGLRGIAAAIVVFHHVFLLSPTVESVMQDGPSSDTSALLNAAVFSPLHFVWGGSEAVYVFFILSGFVLTLPFLRENKPSWLAYYPKRLIRLYIPVWGSIALALIALFAVSREPSEFLSDWANGHAEPADVIRDAVLLFGVDHLNSPLWSLQWEVLFSLLLPLYLLLAVKLRRFWLVGCAGLLLTIAAGSALSMPALIFLPMFGLGVLMAVRKDALHAWGEKMRKVLWAALIVASVLLLTADWSLPDMKGTTVLAAAGAALLVFGFLHSASMIRLGSNAPVQWLGKRSFSLYLVHEPIIITFAFLLNTSNPWLILAVAVPSSLLIAEGFFRGVEKPSHKLANAVGEKVSGATSFKQGSYSP